MSSIIGGHLGQDAVAQAEGQVTKAGELEFGEEFGEDMGSGDDDFGAAGADAVEGAALLDVEGGELLGKAEQSGAGHGSRLTLRAGRRPRVR